MTADDFGTVDIDLLADYIGDALDDTERARVARLIADDSVWRSVHERLSSGMSHVHAELGALGAATEGMPADLGVRLEAAFAADPASEHGLIAPELAEPTEPHLQPSRGDRHLVSVPTGGAAKGAPRRRRLRWAAPIAAAAGVLAFAGFGTAYLTGRDDVTTSSSSSGSADSAASAPMMGKDSSSIGAAPADQITASGADYTDDTLKSGVAALEMAPAEPSSERAAADTQAVRDLSRTPPALVRLREPTALLACLEAITLQNAAGPITVQSIDYATYAGAAALVVRFSAANVDQAWATGPDCGAPGRGAQLRKSVRVG